MYAEGNPKTKKELKSRVANPDDTVRAFQPGGIFESQIDGRAVIEGPHYPKLHRWYAGVLLENGVIVKVLS